MTFRYNEGIDRIGVDLDSTLTKNHPVDLFFKKSNQVLIDPT
jgi:hypothetical protein